MTGQDCEGGERVSAAPDNLTLPAGHCTGHVLVIILELHTFALAQMTCVMVL